MRQITAGRANLRRGASAIALIAAFATAAAAQAGELSGRVLAEGGLPLEGAIVRVAETGAMAATASDGSYRFADLPEGSYTLSVSYVGAAEQTASVAVPSAGAAQQDVTLNAAAAGLGDRVLIVGQRASLYSSLNRQRAADNIQSVLDADAIGRLPDQNVAESVRRLPGVSVENDQGEGRYVVIRGIDPNLNATSVNGVRIPSPEATERKVQLDVIDADILDAVVVTKSLTPDMDGDGIGGSINIETASGFDHDGLFLRGRADGIFTDKSNDLGQRLSLSASDNFGRAALAGSIAWNERTFATDNVEVDGGWTDETAADGGDVWYPEALEYREYNVTRERLSASLNLDVRATDNTNLYVRGLYNDYRDHEFRQRIEVPFDDGDFEADDSSSALGVAAFSGDVAAQRDLKDREETQQIWSAQAGGETFIDAWTVEYSAAFSHAQEEEPGSIDAATFQSDPEGDAPANYRIGVDASEPLFPVLQYNGVADSFFNDPANYEFDALEYVEGLTEDEEAAFRLDIGRDFQLGMNPASIQVGGKARLREKNYEKAITIYDGWNGAGDLTLEGMIEEADYPLGQIGPVVGAGFRDVFDANLGDFEVNPLDTLIADAAEDYVANEDVYALYGMGIVDFGAVRVVGGLRWERTEFEAEAGDVRIFDEYEDTPPIPTLAESGGIPQGGSCFDEDGDPLAATGATLLDQDIVCIGEATGVQDYSDLLPSANLRWDWNPDMVLRASYYRSVGRPNISQVVPTVAIEQDDEGEREAVLGNPALQRQVADNFDATAEWYFAEGGVASAGAFYKTIDDYIATQQFQDVTYFGVNFDDVETAVNLASADIVGLEFNYQQALTFLPGLLNGFIVGVNYTWLDSEGVLADGRVIPLPKTSQNIVGAQLGYEKGGFDIRVTAQYRDDYLDELNTGGNGVDRYVDAHMQWDARVQYDLTQNLTVFADVTNINDEPFTAYLLDGGQELLSQYEDYGWTSSFGLKFQF